MYHFLLSGQTFSIIVIYGPSCLLRAELSTDRVDHGQSCPVTDSNMAVCVHCKEISNRIIIDNSFIMFILQGKGHFCTSRLK